MSNQLSANIKPKNLISALKKAGFVEMARKGSHIRLKHPDGRWTQVAVHSKPVPRGTLRAILKQAELEITDLDL